MMSDLRPAHAALRRIAEAWAVQIGDKVLEHEGELMAEARGEEPCWAFWQGTEKLRDLHLILNLIEGLVRLQEQERERDGKATQSKP